MPKPELKLMKFNDLMDNLKKQGTYRVSYDKTQLEEAIKFISENNIYSERDEEGTREFLMDLIKSGLKKGGDSATSGGFFICFDHHKGFSHIEVYVDPRINKRMSFDDLVETRI